MGCTVVTAMRAAGRRSAAERQGGEQEEGGGDADQQAGEHGGTVGGEERGVFRSHHGWSSLFKLRATSLIGLNNALYCVVAK